MPDGGGEETVSAGGHQAGQHCSLRRAAVTLRLDSDEASYIHRPAAATNRSTIARALGRYAMFIQLRHHDFYIGHELTPTHGLQRILRWVLNGKRTRAVTLFGMCFGSTRTGKH